MILRNAIAKHGHALRSCASVPGSLTAISRLTDAGADIDPCARGAAVAGGVEVDGSSHARSATRRVGSMIKFETPADWIQR